MVLFHAALLVIVTDSTHTTKAATAILQSLYSKLTVGNIYILEICPLRRRATSSLYNDS